MFDRFTSQIHIFKEKKLRLNLIVFLHVQIVRNKRIFFKFKKLSTERYLSSKFFSIDQGGQIF